MKKIPDGTLERVAELRRQLAYHSERYYVEDAPEISDYEYDMMFRELSELEEQNPELQDPASPTHRVGGKALDKFEKFTHKVQMGSLTDVFSYDELSVKEPTGEPSAVIRERVIRARALAAERMKGEKGIFCNAQLDAAGILREPAGVKR